MWFFMQNFFYILIGIIAIFLILRLLMVVKVWTRRGKVAPKVAGQLGRHIESGEKLVAYFYSPTCSACKTQEKYLPRIQEKFKNIIRVNAAKDREMSLAFGIMGTPTTIIIDKGIIKDYFVGITPPQKILHSLGIS
jgi:thioredoxin 1